MTVHRTWYLVADGARAFVLERKGPAGPLERVAGLDLAQELPASRDLGDDRPGRAYESHGAARHAHEDHADPHRRLKRAFAHEIAGRLEAARTDGRFERLVLVAPPVVLGDLRAEISKALSALVTGSLAHDLTKVPLRDLAGHFEKGGV